MLSVPAAPLRPFLSHPRATLPPMSHEALDRIGEMLMEAAEMDLALARRVHARAMAAEDDAALCDLTRAQQRALRSMRQSLALKARLAEIRARTERARAEAEGLRGRNARLAAATPRTPDLAGLHRRRRELAEAAGRVLLRYTEHEDEREALFEMLDQFLDDLDPMTDLSAVTVEDQVAEFCEAADLPAGLAFGWRDLPPTQAPPAPPAAGPPPPPPPADTG